MLNLFNSEFGFNFFVSQEQGVTRLLEVVSRLLQIDRVLGLLLHLLELVGELKGNRGRELV